MKKVTALLLTIMFAVTNATMVHAGAVDKGNPIGSYYYNDMILLPNNDKISLNGNNTLLFIDGTFINSEVIIRNDRALVPVYLLKVGLELRSVDWDDSKKEVTIKKGQKTIVLTIGKDKAYVNGNEIQLDCPAILYKDRTYVPLRFVSEILDAIVSYAPPMNNDFTYYYDTTLPMTAPGTIIRDFANIIVDEKYGDGFTAVSKEEAMKDAKETCLIGLANFTETIKKDLNKSGEPIDKFDVELNSIANEINRMLYIGEVSRYYQFTIGAYDILYDKYNQRKFFIIYSSGEIVKEIDVNDPVLYMPIFFVG